MYKLEITTKTTEALKSEIAALAAVFGSACPIETVAAPEPEAKKKGKEKEKAPKPAPVKAPAEDPGKLTPDDVKEWADGEQPKEEASAPAPEGKTLTYAEARKAILAHKKTDPEVMLRLKAALADYDKKLENVPDEEYVALLQGIGVAV